MNHKRPDVVDVLSVNVSRVTMSQTLSIVERMILGGGSHHVVTVNPEFIMTALGNATFRDILNSADLAIPDGMGIVLASRLLGKPIAERVTGVDLIEQFARVAAGKGFRFFLLGAAPGVAERAAEALKHACSGLVIAGTYSGSPLPAEEEEICLRIRECSPDVLLVAFGSPKQDLWIARTRERLKVPVSIGVGGSLDYIAGVIDRAPTWMRNVGLEWFHRLVNQPERWRRMLALPQFAARVTVQRLGGARSGEGRSRVDRNPRRDPPLRKFAD
ncbi:MAG TPA: WecB/TagA/CpsF family glycosyltransferase [Bacteroidota bacterium]|nr:WecB/TagA/CpsF family glycosyltransferase [Bacteroidota bacterium]